MDAPSPMVRWPVEPPPVLWLALVILGALLFTAVLVEIVRRRRARRRLLKTEWHTAHEIAMDKELSKNEWDVLCSFIKRWSPDQPLRTVTVREHFEHCVAQEMADLSRRNELVLFEETGAVLRDIRRRLALDYVPMGQRINTTRELPDGQLLWVATNTGANTDWIQARVTNVDEAYILAEPCDEHQAAPSLERGGEVRCRLWREDDARYVFVTVVARVESEPFRWVFGHAAELKRMQTREHYRVRHDQTTVVGVLNAPVDGDMTRIYERRVITKARARITSLSAGGFALVAQQSFPQQVLLRITLELDDMPPTEAVARIVATTPISGGRYLVRCAFAGLPEETRDLIAKHVSHQQQPRLTAHSGAAAEQAH